MSRMYEDVPVLVEMVTSPTTETWTYVSMPWHHARSLRCWIARRLYAISRLADRIDPIDRHLR